VGFNFTTIIAYNTTKAKRYVSINSKAMGISFNTITHFSTTTTTTTTTNV
jgi:hypothetical protein